MKQTKSIDTIKSHTQAVLDYVQPSLPSNPIVVEAGSFYGHDTLRMKEFWPNATIHAFEPVPEIFELLQEKTKSVSEVFCHNVALAQHNGTQTFFLSEKPQKPNIASQAGSLLPPQERLKWSDQEFKKQITVNTTTLNNWVNQHKIEHIDFLWLDLQGYELNVLKAAENILPTVRVIYTEVHFCQAYKDQYEYTQVKKWLESHGFTLVAKDFPEQPKWFFGNAVFVNNAIV